MSIVFSKFFKRLNYVYDTGTDDLATEQKAKATYDNILRVLADSDVNDVIKFLRAREIVHFQRSGEALDTVQNRPVSKNFMEKR